MPLLFLCVCLLVFGVGSAAAGQSAPGNRELRVAAATDMQPVFEAIGPVFQKRSGITLKMSYGSSATLAQQIAAGSPVDMFFSADFYFAEKVVSANLTESRTPDPYARGLLAIWAPKGSRLQPLSVETLARHDLGKVAIADQDHAPYGRAAMAALKKLGFAESLAGHLVTAETVGQAAQFALSGNAELALISQTIAMSPRYRDNGTFVLFPPTQYPEIRQTAVILKASPNRAEAHQLLKFMLSDEVQGNLPKLGLRAIK